MIEFIALQRAKTGNPATLFENSITEAVKNQEKSGEKQENFELVAHQRI